MRRSPTPNESMQPPWSSMERIVSSSRLLDATILQSVRPASSSIWRASFDRYARSPESRRIPLRRLPIGIRTSFAVLMAFGTPESRTL